MQNNLFITALGKSPINDSSLFFVEGARTDALDNFIKIANIYSIYYHKNELGYEVNRFCVLEVPDKDLTFFYLKNSNILFFDPYDVRVYADCYSNIHLKQGEAIYDLRLYGAKA